MSSIQNQNGNLTGTLKPQGVLKASISKPTIAIDNLPMYNGPFVVTPLAADDQILSTAGRFNKHDIMVEKIPYSETTTSNTEGKTVSIG